MCRVVFDQEYLNPELWHTFLEPARLVCCLLDLNMSSTAADLPETSGAAAAWLPGSLLSPSPAGVELEGCPSPEWLLTATLPTSADAAEALALL